MARSIRTETVRRWSARLGLIVLLAAVSVFMLDAQTQKKKPVRRTTSAAKLAPARADSLRRVREADSLRVVVARHGHR